jgi:hypothetical protein
MSNDPELYKKLVDDDEDVEEQMKIPLVTVAARSVPKKRSCVSSVCACLCIVLGIFLFSFIVVGAIVGAYAYMMTKDIVQHFTVTNPLPKFPVVDMTDEERAVIKDRVSLFVDLLIAGDHPLDDLTLTQDEINGFICHSDYLRGNLMITLHENTIKEEFSLPMEMLPGGKGRYFVGEDHTTINQGKKMIELEMETAATHEDWFDGPLFFTQLEYLVTKNKDDEGKTMLELFLTKGSFFGQEVPQDLIDKHENLLEAIYESDENKEARAIIEGIERVVIEDGKIVVKPRKD